ncbi:hypothetical protein OKW46_000665 [Paraburkholderia sp. WSM4179]|nr:hypothetical protein [Paraburkholderia sp. WSM4179]
MRSRIPVDCADTTFQFGHLVAKLAQGVDEHMD